MDHGRSFSGVLYAGRICHGGDRIYKSEKLRKHSDEEYEDFVLGSIFFFIIGFALMFGGSNVFIGTAGFFNPKSLADADGMFNGLPIGVFMIFQTVFCATSATIVSGAMAERTKLSLI